MLVRLEHVTFDHLQFESHIFSIHPFSLPNFFFCFLSSFSHCIVKSSLSPSGILLFPSSPSCSPASLPLQSESCRRGLRRSVCLASGLSCYRGLNAMETKFLLHNVGMQVCKPTCACVVVKYGHIPVGLGWLLLCLQLLQIACTLSEWSRLDTDCKQWAAERAPSFRSSPITSPHCLIASMSQWEY